MSPTWLTGDTLGLFAQGLSLTVALTLVTTLLSMVVGVGMGVLRLTPNRLGRSLAALHVAVHRNVPALVLIIFWAFALPNLFPLEQRRSLFFANELMAWIGRWSRLPIPYYGLAVVLALTLNTSAYIAELFRAGVGTIAREHLEAARTLGASDWTLFWRILLLEGMRAAFPAITNRLIHNMKNTALAAFVAVPEFFHSTQSTINATFRAAEFLLLAALVYLGLAYLMAALLGQVERWLARPPQPDSPGWSG